MQVGEGTRAASGARFGCIFHGKETANQWKLEDHIERDKNSHTSSSVCEISH
jgi:hypothetical protein